MERKGCGLQSESLVLGFWQGEGRKGWLFWCRRLWEKALSHHEHLFLMSICRTLESKAVFVGLIPFVWTAQPSAFTLVSFLCGRKCDVVRPSGTHSCNWATFSCKALNNFLFQSLLHITATRSFHLKNSASADFLFPPLKFLGVFAQGTGLKTRRWVAWNDSCSKPEAFDFGKLT